MAILEHSGVYATIISSFHFGQFRRYGFVYLPPVLVFESFRTRCLAFIWTIVLRHCRNYCSLTLSDISSNVFIDRNSE